MQGEPKVKSAAEALGYVLANLVVAAGMAWAEYLLLVALVLGPRPPLAVVQGVALAYALWIAIMAIGGLVHEAGHGLVARLLGLRLLFARLGLVQLTLIRPMRLDWNRRWLTTPFAVSFAPAATGTPRAAWGWVALGGPLASLALAAAAAAASSLWTSSSATMDATLSGLAWFGLAGFAGNLIPGSNGLMRTDGGRLLAVLQRDPHLEASYLMANVVASWMEGARPRDIDDADLARLIAFSGPSPLRALALALALQVARDRGEVGTERELAATLASLVPALSAPLRPSIECELAITGATQGRAQQAQQWLEAARRGRPETDDLWRAEAFVAAAAGRESEARAALVKARAAIARMQTRGLIAPHGEAIDRLELDLDARLRVATES